jgi:hypothetical protein
MVGTTAHAGKMRETTEGAEDAETWVKLRKARKDAENEITTKYTKHTKTSDKGAGSQGNRDADVGMCAETALVETCDR